VFVVLQYGGKGERSNNTTSTEPNNTVNQISRKYLLHSVSHRICGYVKLYNANDNRLISTFKSNNHQLSSVYTYITYTVAFENVPVRNIMFIVLHMYMKVSNPIGYVLLYLSYEAAGLVVDMYCSFIRVWKKCATEMVSVKAFCYSFQSFTYLGISTTYRITLGAEIESHIGFTSPCSHQGGLETHHIYIAIC
jgi:hypothetical protein